MTEMTINELLQTYIDILQNDANDQDLIRCVNKCTQLILLQKEVEQLAYAVNVVLK